MPKCLAGREQLLDSARFGVKSIAEGYQARSVAYYGLRGVGKTVILNEIESIAEEENVLVRHIEVQEKTGFAKSLATASNAFILNLSSRERVKQGHRGACQGSWRQLRRGPSPRFWTSVRVIRTSFKSFARPFGR